MQAIEYVNRANRCDVAKTDVSHGSFRFKTKQPGWRNKSGNRSLQKFQVVQALPQSPRCLRPVQIVEFPFPGSVNLVGKFYDPGISVLWAPSVKVTMQNRFMTFTHLILQPAAKLLIFCDRRTFMMIGNDEERRYWNANLPQIVQNPSATRLGQR
jgi:hypothetical protein